MSSLEGAVACAVLAQLEQLSVWCVHSCSSLASMTQSSPSALDAHKLGPGLAWLGSARVPAQAQPGKLRSFCRFLVQLLPATALHHTGTRHVRMDDCCLPAAHLSIDCCAAAGKYKWILSRDAYQCHPAHPQQVALAADTPVAVLQRASTSGSCTGTTTR